MKPTDILIVILGAACLLMSLVLQPWAELGFGMDPNAITNQSMLSGPLHSLADSYKSLNDLGSKMQSEIFGKLKTTAEDNGVKVDKKLEADWNNPIKAGTYAYIWAMALAMIASALAIILIGKEEGEEITIIPVKK